MIKFEVSEKELETYREWKDNLPPFNKIKRDRRREFFTFEDGPIGTSIMVSTNDGYEKDITDYSRW